jgi:hypothetical protein
MSEPDKQTCQVIWSPTAVAIKKAQSRSLGRQRSWLTLDQKPLGTVTAPADDHDNHGITFDQSDRPEERSYKQGRLDYLNGRNGCPHDGSSVEGQAWLKGHHAEAGGYDNVEVGQDGEVEAPQLTADKGPPPQQPPPPSRDDKPKPQIVKSLRDINKLNMKFKNWNRRPHARQR